MTRNLLILITVVSLIIRLVYSNYPPLLWDETSLGYNAFSILKTAKDEYGVTLPLVFKSFGDYKPGLYVYLALPFIKSLGLNPLSVRLPSIILGSLIPLLTYLIITGISPKSKYLGIISAIVIATNPWNIHFSRGAWETNILLFEILLGCYLFITKKYIFSSLLFSLTLYTYQGGKIMTPLILVILLLVFKPDFKKILTNFITPLTILSLPILFGVIFGKDGNRLAVYSLWSYSRPDKEIVQIIKESSELNYQIFHNHFIFFIKNTTYRYFNHFSFRFLAFEGDWQVSRHNAPYTGVLLYPTAILYFFGLLIALTKYREKLNLFFLCWLLIAPLPAALTRDDIQPVRSLSLSIPIAYFASLTILVLYQKINHYLIMTVLLLVVYSASLFLYLDLYYNHMVKVKPSDWLYGYEQAMKYAIDNDQGRQVTFTDFYGQPYIYYLFYSNLTPSSYQLQAKLTTTGIDVGKVEVVNNYRFTTPDFNRLKSLPHQLIVMSYDDAIRQGINLNTLIPLSPINNISTFYGYKTD